MAVSTGQVGHHAGIELLHELGLGARLLVAPTVAQLAGIALAPRHGDGVLGGAEDGLRSAGARRDDVRVVGQRVDEGGPHGGLPDLPVLAHVVHVSLLGDDHGAGRTGLGPDGVVAGEERTAEGRDEAGVVLVGLDAVAEAAVVSAAEGEDAGDVAGGGGRLDGDGVVLAAADGGDGNLGAVGDVGHLGLFAAGGIFIRLDKDGSTLELGGVGKSQLVGGDEVLAGLTVAQLTEFGQPSRVNVSQRGEQDGELFSTRYLDNLHVLVGLGATGQHALAELGDVLDAGVDAALAAFVAADGVGQAVGIDDDRVGLAGGRTDEGGVLPGSDEAGGEGHGGAGSTVQAELIGLVAAPAVGDAVGGDGDGMVGRGRGGDEGNFGIGVQCRGFLVVVIVHGSQRQQGGLLEIVVVG